MNFNKYFDGIFRLSDDDLIHYIKVILTDILEESILIAIDNVI